MNNAIPLFVIIPLFTAFLIPIVGKVFKGFYKLITPVVFLTLTCLSIYFLLNPLHGGWLYKVGGWSDVQGIPVAIVLVIDALSAFLLLIINLIAFAASFYAVSYINQYEGRTNFFILFCLMAAGMNGVVIAGDIFNLFVFLEISVIASYALVAFGIEKVELEASFKYQVLGGIASLLIIFGIGLLYWQTKTLNIADIAKVLSVQENDSLITFVQVIFLAGFGLKAAMIPFHAWLPDAHSSAPSPISAMLSGVLIKAIGIYAILRLFFNMFPVSYEVAYVITSIGALSMIVGVFLAIGQWDMKRLLAYHSISQMGYVILAVGIGMIIIAQGGDKNIAALSIAGGLFHLINHAVFKGLLFLTAGAVEYETGTRNLKKLGGLSGDMPVTSYSSFGASMAISGIPPFNGFFSKLIIIVAAVKAQFYLLALFAVVVSIITLASFMKVQRYAFFSKPNYASGEKSIREVPFSMAFSMVFLGLLCLALSALILPGVREVVLTPSVNALMNATDYALQVLGN
jgi:multicomponent Na+:H+ antiporter subunit D